MWFESMLNHFTSKRSHMNTTCVKGSHLQLQSTECTLTIQCLKLFNIESVILYLQNSSKCCLELLQWKVNKPRKYRQNLMASNLHDSHVRSINGHKEHLNTVNQSKVQARIYIPIKPSRVIKNKHMCVRTGRRIAFPLHSDCI